MNGVIHSKRPILDIKRHVPVPQQTRNTGIPIQATGDPWRRTAPEVVEMEILSRQTTQFSFTSTLVAEATSISAPPTPRKPRYHPVPSPPLPPPIPQIPLSVLAMPTLSESFASDFAEFSHAPSSSLGGRGTTEEERVCI